MCDNKSYRTFHTPKTAITRFYDMNDKQNWTRTGEQIKDAVTDALQSGDFRELNRLVSQTVTNTLDEVGIHITFDGDASPQDDQYQKQQQTWQEEQMRRRQEQQMRQQQEMQRRQQEQQMRRQQEMQRRQEQQMRRQQEQQMRRQTQMQTASGTSLSPVKMKRIGSVSNILYQVFGGIGLGFTAIVAFVRLIVLAAGATTPAGWIVNLAFLALFWGMIHLGIVQRKRLKRAERYASLCGSRMFGEIAYLARNTGKNERYVTKDLQKMLKLGIFPEGHLDEQNTCFMLNDQVYRQYLEAENNRRQREEDAKKALMEKETAQTKEAASPEDTNEQEAELNTMVAEGMEYIRKLRDLNDRIPGDVISAKLFRLESLLKEIFDSVREHPEQMHRMHKLMDYYLPTTLKLVESYEEFDQVSSPGEDIVKAKAEIENTLDTINQAFTELLNNLFQDAVFDATTDAQVLKTMLAKEGLMREMEFVTNSRES